MKFREVGIRHIFRVTIRRPQTLSSLEGSYTMEVGVANKLRQLLLWILARWYRRTQKEIGVTARIPPKRVSQLLTRDEIDDDVFNRLLAAIRCRPAAVSVVITCLEGLEAVDQANDLTEEELAVVEDGAQKAARLTRQALLAAVRRSRVVVVEGYPRPADLAPDRQRAEELYAKLKPLSEAARLDVVRAGTETWSWALCERLCEQSVREASRNIKRAAGLARLAQEIADHIHGPEGWRNKVRGFAMAHGANILRVSGELKAAEAAFEEAKRLWHAGSDPDAVLDPGRLLELEASLLKDQRRLKEALDCLEGAATLGRRPAQALMIKGIILEKLGEYQEAVETLIRAEPLVDRQDDPLLRNRLNLNLAVCCCHLSRFKEAAALINDARPLSAELEDEIVLVRITWLEGRIEAGLGRPWEALRLLGQARRQFAAEGMSYDVALALLEEAALLLDERRTQEVKVLGKDLTKVFESKGVHREALAALKLFQEAVEREQATADLARSVLRFLFRARYDQGLRFADL